MPASSTSYSATLSPAATPRRFVLVAGFASACAGTLILATLPLAAGLAWPAAVAWTGWVGVELLMARRAYRDCSAYTLAAGGKLSVTGQGGGRLAGDLAPGSVVLANYAWLRVAVPGRRPWGELLRRQDQDREQWRRFQVICRHLPA
ncbi:MAG TPA: hypothetical protein VFY03_05425 [Woeseiaceae bacterium]|nr:hypothetical protein [Woeseiaceae bacterium]